MKSKPLTSANATGPANAISIMVTKNPGFVPSDLSGLMLWFDSHDPDIAVNPDGSGGHPGVDGLVGYWPNRVASSPAASTFDLVDDDTRRPKWTTNGVFFDPANDTFLSMGSNGLNPLIDGAAGITMGAVFSIFDPSSSSEMRIFSGIIDGNGSGVTLRMNSIGGLTKRPDILSRSEPADPIQNVVYSVADQYDQKVIAKFDFPADEVTINANEASEQTTIVSYNSTAYNAGNPNSLNVDGFGAYGFTGGGSTGLLKGWIQAFVLYDRVLNDEETGQLQQWLNAF